MPVLVWLRGKQAALSGSSPPDKGSHPA